MDNFQLETKCNSPIENSVMVGILH